MNKIVLVTGATSGIGKACAEKFASQGYDVIITGRRIEKLQLLKSGLEKQFGIKILSLCFDIQNKNETFKAIEDLPAEWQQISILINNAGLALGRDPFDTADMSDWETMLHTNVEGLLYMSRAVLPLMKKTGNGQIINIGSIAGKEVYENGNVYCASKFAVDAITKAMRIDLLKHGIKVTAVHPGAVVTEFSIVRFKGDEEKADATYKGFEALSGADIADTIFYCASLPAHVCINELTVMPTAQASATYIHRKD